VYYPLLFCIKFLPFFLCCKCPFAVFENIYIYMPTA
jgi:hypothetical protein